MNELDGHNSHHSEERGRKPATLVAVGILLFVECLLVAGAAVYLLVELLIDTPQSFASAVAILVLTALAAVGVAVVTVKLLAGEAWTRGAVVVWQVLQASIGFGSLQGLYARPDVGWPLILLAVAVLVLMFTKPVLAATARREHE